VSRVNIHQLRSEDDKRRREADGLLESLDAVSAQPALRWLEELVPLIPTTYANLTRFHGVFAPTSPSVHRW
jgi:hypothetical protein